jgi:hypothetical protein
LLGRRLFIGAMAITALAAAACDIPESPLEPGARQLLVQAVLDASASRQLVTVGWSDESQRLGWEAVVTLIYPDGREVRAVAQAGSIETHAVFTAGSNRIQSGAEYGLRVVDGSTVVTGRTAVPNAQPVTELVNETFSRRGDTLRLAWPRVPGAKAYHIAIQNSEGTYYSTFADTSIAVAGTLRTLEGEAVFEADVADVVVSAVDENFYVYYHAAIDPFAGAPPSRLNGGLGVFGAIVPIVKRRLTVGP